MASSRRPFRVRRGVLEVSLPGEIRLQLREAAELVLSLVEPGEDELFPSALAPPAPTDAALARLLPDAYATTEDASEFRRLTDGELRAGKRRDAERLLETAQEVALEPETGEAWLRALNDCRLILAVRLEIERDEDAERLFDELSQTTDPLAAARLISYLQLGMVQEALIDALD